MPLQKLGLILISVAFLASFISAILACCLKGQKRLRAVDSLLIAATMLIAIALGMSLVPSEKKSLTATSQSTLKKLTKAIKECDKTVDSVSESGYATELSEPARTIITAVAAHSKEKELQRAEESVQKSLDEFPNSHSMAARLMIILHAEGKVTAPTFAKFAGSKSALTCALASIYDVPNANNSAIAQTNWKTYEQTIKSFLPKGWYQNVALIDLYRKYDPVALKTALEAEHRDSVAWQFRIVSYLIVDAVIVILGLVSIVLFLRAKQESLTEALPITTDFRRMYGILISTIFTQIIVGIGFGIYLGVSSIINKTPLDVSDYNSAMMPVLLVSGAITCLLLFYFLILKPQALNLNVAFTRSAPKLTYSKFALACVGGFCAGSVMNLLARTLYHFVPNAGRSTNPAHLEMVSSIMAGDVPRILQSIAFACFLAPFIEEIMFRGLLFGWLRYKFGAVPAIIVSSALFALWHLDPNGFVQYFSLGMVLSIAYNRTRNLWISIFIHAMWNSWVMATVYWVTTYHR